MYAKSPDPGFTDGVLPLGISASRALYSDGMADPSHGRYPAGATRLTFEITVPTGVLAGVWI